MAELQTKRYPVRGALWGLLLGLAAAYFLFFEFAVFGFDSVGGVITKIVIILVIAMVVGILWAYVAPPRTSPTATRGAEVPPPAPGDEMPPPAPEGESPPPAPEDESPPPAPEDETSPADDEEPPDPTA